MANWRTLLSTAVAVVLGAGMLTACSSDPTPTNVKVSWADDTRQAVRVSWKDSGAPNRITVEGVLSTNPTYVQYVPDDDSNSWDIPTSIFPPDGTYKVAVGVGTSTGGLTSKLVRSPVFDTNGPVRPSGATAVPQGQDVLMRWTVPPAPQDFTPNDPLDVTGKVQYYVPEVGKAGEPLQPAGTATTTQRQVIKNLKPPYLLQLRAQNEWNSTVGGQISARTSETTAAVPGLAQYSLTLQIRGRTVLQEVSCPVEGRCVQQRATAAGLPVMLMTQVTPKARWTPAARGVTTAGGHFQVAVVNTASRPYKVVVPLYSRVGVLAAESESKPRYTKSVVRVQTAGFLDRGMRKRNQTATVQVIVQPAITGTAMLHFWNRQTRKWTNVKAVALVKGKGAFSFKATKLGLSTYRFAIPGAAMAGRKIDPTMTANLNLSVRP